MTRPSLLQVIERLEDLFEGLGLTRSYGGAIAYNYYGPPRMTQDVDVLVLVPDLRVPWCWPTRGCWTSSVYAAMRVRS